MEPLSDGEKSPLKRGKVGSAKPKSISSCDILLFDEHPEKPRHRPPPGAADVSKSSSSSPSWDISQFSCCIDGRRTAVPLEPNEVLTRRGPPTRSPPSLPSSLKTASSSPTSNAMTSSSPSSISVRGCASTCCSSAPEVESSELESKNLLLVLARPCGGPFGLSSSLDDADEEEDESSPSLSLDWSDELGCESSAAGFFFPVFPAIESCSSVKWRAPSGLELLPTCSSLTAPLPLPT